MIDQKFCFAIERAISQGLLEFTDKTVQGMWIDDVVFESSDRCFTKKFVNDKRYMVLRLYAIGVPKEIYDLILSLGNKALSRYARGLDLLNCIPSQLNESNMTIDFEKAEITVALL